MSKQRNYKQILNYIENNHNDLFSNYEIEIRHQLKICDDDQFIKLNNIPNHWQYKETYFKLIVDMLGLKKNEWGHVII